MSELHEFIAGALVVLLTPGPTNTLLGTSGALHGAPKTLPLVTAEMAGYTIAVSLLQIVVAPIAEMFDGVRMALQLICAAYLALVAWHLWSLAHHATAGAITWRRVFFVTLANPKAIIFSSVLLPPCCSGASFQIRAAVLLGLIAGAGITWVTAGAWLRTTTVGRYSPLIRRTSAVVLAFFSCAILINAMTFLIPYAFPQGAGLT